MARDFLSLLAYFTANDGGKPSTFQCAAISRRTHFNNVWDDEEVREKKEEKSICKWKAT